MDKDIRVVYSEFNEESLRIFFSLFNKFRNEADVIERDGYENVFQLLRSKYIILLKQSLERCAANLVEQCNTAESQGRLRIGFAEKITYFTREFLRKSGSL